ncbi:MAG: GWxTD domain-containing protein, partial [bacterium]
YLLNPGNYLLTVTAMDTQGKRIGRNYITVIIDPYYPDSLTTSDIELGYKILPPGIHPQFHRGEFTFIPSPRRLFGGDNPYFFYYLEVYPPRHFSSPQEFRLRRFLLSAYGDTVRLFPDVTFSSSNAGFGDTDSLSLMGLSQGTYRFQVEVISPDGYKWVASRRLFLLGEDYSGKARFVHPPDSLKTEQELAQISFLIPSRDMDRLMKASLREKVEFLNNFWKRYDDDPTTSEVPARTLFSLRVSEADQMFTTSRIPGHKTPRGRIYILYGEPEEKEYHPFDVEAKPYEIWRYNRYEGGLIFVFVDRSGMGEFELVHSTKRGEVYEPQWYERYVNRSGTETRR